jgi:hypothetical protein
MAQYDGDGMATNPPGDDFDALGAPDDVLAQYCLPPRPNPRHMPSAYANWVRAMASRPHYVPALPPPSPARRHLLIAIPPNDSITQVSSSNWSGAVVRATEIERMALVQGRWIVPDAPITNSALHPASSVWVGFDGYEPASRIIPQIGTGQHYNGTGQHGPPPSPGGTPPVNQQFAWWQVWIYGDKRERESTICIPIRPTDRIYAQVQILAPMQASLFIKNETTNQACALYYDGGNDHNHHEVPPFERLTAQWIVERPLAPDPFAPPSDNATDKLIVVPLADYGTTAFTDCNGAAETADGRMHEFQLERARLIRMNDWDDKCNPGRLTSLPERIGDDAIQMIYVKAP